MAAAEIEKDSFDGLKLAAAFHLLNVPTPMSPVRLHEKE
jgi:hypothetical protein